MLRLHRTSTAKEEISLFRHFGHFFVSNEVIISFKQLNTSARSLRDSWTVTVTLVLPTF